MKNQSKQKELWLRLFKALLKREKIQFSELDGA